MRTLLFNGKFGYLKEIIHEGIVVFCHFEPEDNEKIILQAVKKFQSIVKKNLILVPFAHLHEKTASKEEAKILFKILIDESKKNEKWNIITIPFGIEKEFFLYAPADNSAVKFLKFTNKSKQKEIVNLYDLCYIDYDKHMSETGHYKAQEKILSSIIDYIKEPILDLACGTGFLINLLSKSFSNIIGNDFSSSMAKIASTRNNLMITNENAEILESQKQKFKTIISCNLFFYLQNRDKAIKRWAKLLDKNGKIIFIEEYPFIKPKSEEMDKHTEKLMSLIDPISPEGITEIMVQNGFLLVKEIKTTIDEKHNLYGLVFSLK